MDITSLRWHIRCQLCTGIIAGTELLSHPRWHTRVSLVLGYLTLTLTRLRWNSRCHLCWLSWPPYMHGSVYPGLGGACELDPASVAQSLSALCWDSWQRCIHGLADFSTGYAAMRLLIFCFLYQYLLHWHSIALCLLHSMSTAHAIPWSCFIYMKILVSYLCL